MAQPIQAEVRNLLLRSLSQADFELLQPHLLLVTLALRQVVIEPDTRVEHLYFMEMGLASITTPPAMRQVEVGILGWDGLVGATPIVLGVNQTPLQTMIQMKGEGLRISTSDFLSAMERSPSLTALLLRYVQSLLVQTAQTAYANAFFGIDSRLARWILMCHDRTDGDDLALTHEFLSIMLGVHRPAVTVATQVLEGSGLIRARRGRITILDRAGLEAVADLGYGMAEAYYASLIEAK